LLTLAFYFGKDIAIDEVWIPPKRDGGAGGGTVNGSIYRVYRENEDAYIYFGTQYLVMIPVRIRRWRGMLTFERSFESLP
jgi:hypothetical protein